MTASEVAPAGGGMPSIFASLPGIFQLVALFMFVGWLRQWRKERWAKEAKAEAEAQAVARRRGLVGDITLEILATFNGTDPAKQILLAVKGIVFDVTKGHKHYGPGKVYSAYAGREVARALALGSTSADDCTADLSGLSELQRQRLQKRTEDLAKTYDAVGQIASEPAMHDGRMLAGAVIPSAAVGSSGGARRRL